MSGVGQQSFGRQSRSLLQARRRGTCTYSGRSKQRSDDETGESRIWRGSAAWPAKHSCPESLRIQTMHTFLLGAGCSYGTLRNHTSGAPLARDFGRHVAKMNSQGHYRELEAVARHLGSELSQIGLEKLWSCLDHYAKFAQWRGGFLSNPGWSLDEAICQLKRALLAIYGRKCEDAAKHISTRTNCTLVQLLSERIQSGDVVISFNYDTLVERLARKCGLRFVHCSGAPPKNKVKFLKPHGSLSWRIRDLGTAGINGTPLRKSLGEASVLPGCSPTEPLVLGAVPIKSELIREVQLQYGARNVFEVVMQQWCGVVEAIRDADVVVVVGYSFPKEDQYGRFFLEEGVRRRHKRLLRIEYYNVNRDSEAAIREVFGNDSRILWKRAVTPARQRQRQSKR